MSLARLLSTVCVVSIVSCAAPCSAADPERVAWSEDWPRVRVVEVLDVVALTIASPAIEYTTPVPHHADIRGHNTLDDWARSAFRGRTYGQQAFAIDWGDNLYKIGTFAPYVIDVWIVALGVHQSADVALQMTLINMQSLGMTGVLTLGAEHSIGRARPYVADCGPGGQVRDAAGAPLPNACAPGSGDYQSFYSGHAAAVATMAGLTCIHHQHLPLYGGGIAEVAPCAMMIGAAGFVGYLRLVADRHWATDVLLGWGVGAASGYLVPAVLHYGFGAGRPIGEVRIGGAVVVPVPEANPRGAGLGLAGVF